MPKMLLPPRHDWCGQFHEPGACPAFGPQAQKLHEMAAAALTEQNYVLAGLLSRTLDDLGYQLRRATARGGPARPGVSYHVRRDDLARSIRAIASGIAQDAAAVGPDSPVTGVPVPGVPASGCDCGRDGGQGLAPNLSREHTDGCPASPRYAVWLGSWERCSDRSAYASAAEHRRDCPQHQTDVPVGGDITPAAAAEGLATGGVVRNAQYVTGLPEGPAERMTVPGVGPWFGQS